MDKQALVSRAEALRSELDAVKKLIAEIETGRSAGSRM